MTTTIANATLTVTVTEAVTLNGYDQGSSNTLTLPNIDEVVKRIVTISTTETGLLSFSAASTTAVAATAVMVDGGNSFIYCCDTVDGAGTVATMDANTAALTVALDNLADITADASTGVVDLEVFVASV